MRKASQSNTHKTTRSSRNRTRSIDGEYLDEVEKAPRRLVAKKIRAKLRSLGVSDRRLLDRVGRKVLRGDDTFEEDLPPEIAASLPFTEVEWDELQASMDEFLGRLPDVTEKAIIKSAREILREVRADWRQRGWTVIQEFEAFRTRLAHRWGAAFDDLQLLETLCRETGSEELERHKRSRAKTGKPRRELLIRLHARACLVSSEVFVLMRNGFADGAMARWRTLHELGIVAILIASGDDQLAQRYLDHEAVEAKRAMDLFLKDHEALGSRGPSKREIEGVQRAFEDVMARHGSDFGTQYGWASRIVGKKSPTFAQLEALAGRSELRSYYKMASYPVHAGAKGITTRLSTLDSGQTIVASASNAGLEEPGQHMALSLVLITSLIMPARGLEDAIPMRVIVEQRDRAISSLMLARKRLLRDHISTRNLSG